MLTTKHNSEVCAYLRTFDEGRIVGLEGFCGSGKSTLAEELSKRLLVDVCHVDNFARKFDRPPGYAECLDLVGLRCALEQRDQSRLTVVEGICLRDVLALVGIPASNFVYIKRIGKNGLWHDELHLEDFEAAHPISREINEPHRSDFEYHTRVRPHEHAELVYQRTERN
jgi:broad-specificity NMP kinase